MSAAAHIVSQAAGGSSGQSHGSKGRVLLGAGGKRAGIGHHNVRCIEEAAPWVRDAISPIPMHPGSSSEMDGATGNALRNDGLQAGAVPGI